MNIKFKGSQSTFAVKFHLNFKMAGDAFMLLVKNGEEIRSKLPAGIRNGANASISQRTFFIKMERKDRFFMIPPLWES